MLSDKNSYAIVGAGDIARARRFYEDTLGLAFQSGEEESALTFRTGDTFLTVYQSDNFRPSTANAVAWSAAGGDVEAIASGLRGKGITLEEYPNMGMEIVDGVHRQGDFRAIWFKDPDGNILHVNSM